MHSHYITDIPITADLLTKGKKISIRPLTKNFMKLKQFLNILYVYVYPCTHFQIKIFYFIYLLLIDCKKKILRDRKKKCKPFFE